MPNNKILFAGDPHGCFANIISAVYQYKPEAVVMLSDYNLEMPLERYLAAIIGMTKIYWIAGNHDFDSITEYECLFRSALMYGNIHMKVIEVGGLRIAGLAGVFLNQIWMPGSGPQWTDRKHWKAHQPRSAKTPLYIDSAIWHHELEHMKESVRADILVTHEAPSSHRHGFSVIDELAQAIGARQIFHGHHHSYYQDKLPNGINVTGVSIGGVTDLASEQLF
jgi:predicted phosphodiesterase